MERLVHELFGAVSDGAALHSHRLGNGVAIFSRDEKISLLNALRWHPADITFRETSQYVGFVHRKTTEHDYYFLANTSERPQRLDATFRVEAKQPETWDLKTGTVTPLLTFEHTKAGTSVAFDLGPHASCVIAFAQNGRSPAAVDTDLHLEATHEGWMARAFENRNYYIQDSHGRKQMFVSGIPAPIEVAPRWSLRFEDTSITPVTLEELKSWTDIPSARFFSGRGIYEAEFPMALKLPADVGAVLDLGGVRETAEVWLNDGTAGVAWMQPYHLDVTRLVRMGTNRLRIHVTNLLINRVLGLGPIDYSKVYERYGQRFPPGEEWEKVREPFPSGLLGPVRLVFYKIIQGGRTGREKPGPRVRSAVA